MRLLFTSYFLISNPPDLTMTEIVPSIKLPFRPSTQISLDERLKINPSKILSQKPFGFNLQAPAILMTTYYKSYPQKNK